MFQLNILTPESELYAGQARALTVKAVDGEVGVLTNHAPLITALAPGSIRYQTAAGQETSLRGSGGFLKIDHNQVFVLLQS